MIGREAYGRPWLMRSADVAVFGAKHNPNLSRREIVARLGPKGLIPDYVTVDERGVQGLLKDRAKSRVVIGVAALSLPP
ncbi:hypothetical protein T484DRAFT_1793782 [Baffinella frigidus]|nr:hypothetical protein T484DRAFT_1793782 [Cryptophyta sp. CCMP2293]